MSVTPRSEGMIDCPACGGSGWVDSDIDEPVTPAPASSAVMSEDAIDWKAAMQTIEQQADKIVKLEAERDAARSALNIAYWRFDRVHGTFEIPFGLRQAIDDQEIKLALMDWKAEIHDVLGNAMFDEVPPKAVIDRRRPHIASPDTEAAP